MSQTEGRFTRSQLVTLMVAFLGTGIVSLALLALFSTALQSLLRGDPESVRLTSWLAASVGVLGAAGATSVYVVVAGGLDTMERLIKASRLSLALAVIGFIGASLGYDAGVLPTPVAAIFHASAFCGTTALLVLTLLRSVRPGTLDPGPVLHGIWIAPLIALSFETLLAVLGLVIAVSAFAMTEAGRSWLRTLPDPSVITATPIRLAQVAPLLQQPLTLGLALLGLTVLIPVLEETAKSLWSVPLALFGGIKPMQGFAAGAMSGAGFGLAEAIFVTQPEAGWSVVFLTRIGASLMHATTSGILGWGIARFARSRKLLTTAGAFLGAVMFHGLWNLGALGVATSELDLILPSDSWLVEFSGILSVLGVVLIIALLLGAIVGLGTVLRVQRSKRKASDRARES